MVEPRNSYSYTMAIPAAEDLVEVDLSDGTRMWFPSTWTTTVKDQHVDGIDVDVSLTFESQAGTVLPRCTRVEFEVPQTEQAAMWVSMLQHQLAEISEASANADRRYDRIASEHTDLQLYLAESTALLEARSKHAVLDGQSDDVERVRTEIEVLKEQAEAVSRRFQEAADAARAQHQEHHRAVVELDFARKLKGISVRAPGIGEGARVPNAAELKVMVVEARLWAAQRSPDPHDVDNLIPSKEAEANLRRSMRSRRKLRITDELLAEVAALYREAIDKGQHPRGYIKERVTGGPVSTSTVATWIGLARQSNDPQTGKPFLGPAKGTRAGERPAGPS